MEVFEVGKYYLGTSYFVKEVGTKYWVSTTLESYWIQYYLWLMELPISFQSNYECPIILMNKPFKRFESLRIT